MVEQNIHNTIIVGIAPVAQSIALQIIQKKIIGTVIGFISEKKSFPSSIANIPVLGTINQIKEILQKHKCDSALIALPNHDTQQLQDIFSRLQEAGVPDIRILPELYLLEETQGHLIQAREIEMEDLLGRAPVKINLRTSLNYLRGKRVLVTGAGGSIGSELSRQLLYGGAQRLYLLDHSENNLYQIEKELRVLQEEGVGEKAVIVPIIGELQDKDYVNFILKRLKSDVIFHTAAYKQVPLMEHNPIEVIKNNLFGTKFLLEAASANNAQRFVFISTDKAVSPSSIYGVSKLLCEQLVLHEAQKGNRDFIVVRFGNVLGSMGSIVPLFKEQIKKGGPVTVTHQDIDRFFMTIPEASSLVLKAGGTGKSGQLYILDMGEPIKIIDLAKQMIRFYGFEPNKEIPIKITGLRVGEKLHEKLYEDNQEIRQTPSPKINQLINPILNNLNIPQLMNQLEPICFFSKNEPELYRNRIKLKQLLSHYFTFLKPSPKEPEY